MQHFRTDVLVLGSGIAGLAVALNLVPSVSVTILTKAQHFQSNSYRAQGGIAAAVGTGDSPALHQADTLQAGMEMCDPRSVALLTTAGPAAIQSLVEWGVPFDRLPSRVWSLACEGAHSKARILHAGGDQTGAVLVDTLLQCIARRDTIELHTHAFAFDLWIQRGICRGAWVLREGELVLYEARRGVVLATGGGGQVYRYTTNDLVATGDGFALAYQAGVSLLDMEFVQFHPTALAIEQNPMMLVSEAVRGEGARLVNKQGDFLFGEQGHDLLPRDVVARAIYRAQRSGQQIYLDARSLGAVFSQRFPKIHLICEQAGIDPATMPIPVTPAAHFMMGGIEVDLAGATSLPHLYACGEVACTGAHGANRLASNSLLEGVVFAERVAQHLLANSTPQAVQPPRVVPRRLPAVNAQHKILFQTRLQQLMWESAAMVRTQKGLQAAEQQLLAWQESLPVGCFSSRSLWLTASAIIQAALWRCESRGGHYRADCPRPLPEWVTRHKRVIRHA